MARTLEFPAPPNSERLERSALCCLMLSERACFAALNDHGLTREHFYADRHRLLFREIRAAYDEGCYEGGMLDLVLLYDRLERAGRANEVGGLDYLHELYEFLPTTAAVGVYVRRLAELMDQRRLVEATERANDLARSGDAEGARAVIAKASEGAPVRDVLKGPEVQVDALVEQLVSETAGGSVGPSTGFARLDRIIGGFVRGRSYVLGGLTSVGKTALVLQFALEAGKQGAGVYVFSKEMPHADCRRRMAAVMAGIPLPPKALAGLNDEQNERLDGALKMLRQLPIDIDDRPADLAQMERVARARRGSVALFVIDHAQIVSVPGVRTEYEAISAVSRAAKQTFALECEAACLLLSQFSREAARDKDPKPHQLRGSGALEQDTNVGMTLTRKAYMTSERTPEASLRVWKNRDGRCGTVPLEWDKRLARYLEPDEERVQECGE